MNPLGPLHALFFHPLGRGGQEADFRYATIFGLNWFCMSDFSHCMFFIALGNSVPISNLVYQTLLLCFVEFGQVKLRQ